MPGTDYLRNSFCRRALRHPAKHKKPQSTHGKQASPDKYHPYNPAIVRAGNIINGPQKQAHDGRSKQGAVKTRLLAKPQTGIDNPPIEAVVSRYGFCAQFRHADTKHGGKCAERFQTGRVAIFDTLNRADAQRGQYGELSALSARRSPRPTGGYSSHE